MAKYDVERLLADLLAIATSNLNTKITALNAEKNDAIVLAQWDTTKAFLQDLTKSDAASSSLFLFYGVNDPQVQGIGPASALVLELFYLLVMEDTAEGSDYMIRMFRYMRALQEIYQESYAKIPQVARIIVTSLAPESFQMSGGGTYRATGVRVKTSIA